MRVLYLAPPASESGRLAAYTFLDEEIVALAKAGIEIVLVAPTPPSEAQSPQDPTVSIRVLPPARTLREVWRTLAFIWRRRRCIPLPFWLRPRLMLRTLRIERFAYDLILFERIDLVHSNFGWPGGFGGSVATEGTSTRLVTTLRGMDILQEPSIGYGLRRSRCYDLALRRLLRKADYTIHVSEFVRRRAIALGAPQARARTVRKGVDCERFLCSEPQSGQSPVILTVAGLIKRKGIHHILEALSLLADSHEFSFIVVGQGPELADLEKQCERLQIRERTRFAGYVSREHIPEWFAACDIFMLASTLEASGNVLLEAMASGRPVICTASGGPAEYVDDRVTGFVVPVGDTCAMAEKIAILLNDAEIRRVLGRNGRTRARQHFPYSRMIADLIDVYRNAVES